MSLIHRLLVKSNDSSASSKDLSPEEKKKLDDLRSSPKPVNEFVFAKVIGTPVSESSSFDTELNDDEEDFTFPDNYPKASPPKKP